MAPTPVRDRIRPFVITVQVIAGLLLPLPVWRSPTASSSNGVFPRTSALTRNMQVGTFTQTGNVGHVLAFLRKDNCHYSRVEKSLLGRNQIISLLLSLEIHRPFNCQRKFNFARFLSKRNMQSSFRRKSKYVF